VTSLSAALLALHLPSAFGDKLNNFASLFLKWNQSINLSAARTDAELRSQVIDCLHAVPHLAQPPSVPPTETRLLDVGAGGGLPAIVAAVCLPDVQVIALEPVHKKHAFLRTAARELSLPNLEPRAERLDAHTRFDYDAAMSRATFDLREWLRLGLARVRPGGLVLGFEASPRSDLPPETARTSYDIDAKPRAIVTLRRPLETAGAP